MRIVCFVLGVLCLLGSAGLVVLGTLDLGGESSTSRPAADNLRVQEVVRDEPNLDDFGPATTLAGVFALAGVAWMVGAVAFAPKQVAAAGGPQQWQAPQYAPQQYPPSGGVAQQAYPPQGHGQQPPQQVHGQQSAQQGHGQPPQQG